MVLLLLRQVGTTEHRSRGAAETATRNLLQKGCPVIQRGILVFTLTSIRRKELVVKYLYYLIYYYTKQKYIFCRYVAQDLQFPSPRKSAQAAQRDDFAWETVFMRFPKRACCKPGFVTCSFPLQVARQVSHRPKGQLLSASPFSRAGSNTRLGGAPRVAISHLSPKFTSYKNSGLF